MARYLETMRDLPVRAPVEPGEVRAKLPASPPEEAEPFEAVLRDLDEIVVPGTTHWNHPRFFAYFAITGSEPGILAELLSAAFNVNAMLWRTGPAATELEEVALDWLRQLLALPEGLHGHIEDTASTSTLAALAAARELRPGGAVLCSEHAHSSVDKAARILGMELRKVAVDDEFRLRLDALAERLGEGDAAAVVATVGTTSTTSVDPVPGIADLCERHGAWLHVDAAYAGSAFVCPEHRWAMEGVERADSLVVNPHKWLFTPVDCSALYTRRPEALRAAFSLLPEYLRTGVEDVTNLMDYGPALGRRFRALKLWTVIRCYGREGLQALIREHVRLAHLFASWVEAEPGWEIAAPYPFSVVCFRREGSDEENEELMERVNATGEVVPLAHEARRPLRPAPRGRECPHHRGRRRPRVGAPALGVKIEAVDYHTAGEPFRIVTGGVEQLQGRTILEKRRWALEHVDHVRQLLVFEPRGHADMYGCFVTEPEDEAADLGVVFFHNAGYSTACGHGTIALATWALDEGLVGVQEPVTELVVDVPSGRLAVSVAVAGGRPQRVRFRNVPAWVHSEGLEAPTSRGVVRVDVAYGGAFYASVRVADLGLTVESAALPALIEQGREIKRSLEASAGVRPLGGARAAGHLRRDLLAGRERRLLGAGPTERHRLRGRRGRPLAVRERDLGAARTPRRSGVARTGRDPAAPGHRRDRVRGAGRRRDGGGRPAGGRDRDRGQRVPNGHPRLRAPRRRRARHRLPAPLMPRVLGFRHRLGTVR